MAPLFLPLGAVLLLLAVLLAHLAEQIVSDIGGILDDADGLGQWKDRNGETILFHPFDPAIQLGFQRDGIGFAVSPLLGRPGLGVIRV